MSDIVGEFEAIPGAWMMQFDDGWWAYFYDELPLGPFATRTEAAGAAARAGWIKAKPDDL